MTELIIDGRKISCFADFVSEFNQAYFQKLGNPIWSGRDFNELDEFLQHAAPVTLRWQHAAVSREVLGYEAMADWWKESLDRNLKVSPKLQFAHQWSIDGIADAQKHQGRTLFEYLCWQMEQPGCKIVLE